MWQQIILSGKSRMKMTDEIFHQVKSQQNDLSAINQKRKHKATVYIISIHNL